MKITIEIANINDIDEIINLKKNIWDEIENKNWYVIDGITKEFLENQINNDGLVLKAIHNNSIVGFLVVENNIREDSSIMKLTNLNDENEKCIEMSNVGINKLYRGNNLFCQMIKKAEKIMLKKYDIKYILSTVHPDNVASLKSLLNSGYNIFSKVKMYDNFDRYILIKRIK